MKSHCEDCGTREYDGVCPNCHEELYIAETQFDSIEYPVSEEFEKKVYEQRKIVERKLSR